MGEGAVVGGGEVEILVGWEGGFFEEVADFVFHFALGVVFEVFGAGAAEGTEYEPVFDGDAVVGTGEGEGCPGAGVEAGLGGFVVGFAAGGAVAVGPPEFVVAAEVGVEVDEGAEAGVEGFCEMGDGGGEDEAFLIGVEEVGEVDVFDGVDVLEGDFADGGAVGLGFWVFTGPGGVEGDGDGLEGAVVLEETENEADIAGATVFVGGFGIFRALEIEADRVGGGVVGEEAFERGKGFGSERGVEADVPAEVEAAFGVGFEVGGCDGWGDGDGVGGRGGEEGGISWECRKSWDLWDG